MTVAHLLQYNTMQAQLQFEWEEEYGYIFEV